MEMGTFRRNALMTISSKDIKLAMRTASRNTLRAVIVAQVMLAAAAAGKLIQGLNGYLLGMQWTDEMKDVAFFDMGELGFQLVVLSRYLKVKLPSATKKIKLVGTRGAGLHQLHSLIVGMLETAAPLIAARPAMKMVEKQITIPATGAKETRNVWVEDKEAVKKSQEEVIDSLRSQLTNALDLYFRLSFNMFGHAPAAIFEEKMKRLEKEFPTVEFEKESIAA